MLRYVLKPHRNPQDLLTYKQICAKLWKKYSANTLQYSVANICEDGLQWVLFNCRHLLKKPVTRPFTFNNY